MPLLEQEEQVVVRAAVPAADQASDIVLISGEQGECPLSLEPRISRDGQLSKKLCQVDWLTEKMREANFSVSFMHGSMP